MVQPELDLCTEQEFTVFQIGNTISSYFEYIDVSPVNVNKEAKQLSLDAISKNNSLSKLKALSKTESKHLLTNRTLHT